MTETERRDPEPSPLIMRLLRRRTEPIGIIDVRRPQAHYARVAGWVAARFPLLAELAERHDLGEEDAAGAAEFIHVARRVPRSQDQAVLGPGIAAVQRSGPGPSPPSPSGSSLASGNREGVGTAPGRANGPDLRLPAAGLPRVNDAVHAVSSATRLQGNPHLDQPHSRGKEPSAMPAPVQPPLPPAAERLKTSSPRRGGPSGSPAAGENRGEVGSSPASLDDKPPVTRLATEPPPRLSAPSPAVLDGKPPATVWRVRRGAPPASPSVLSAELTRSLTATVRSPLPQARSELAVRGMHPVLTVSPSARREGQESSLPPAPVLKRSVQSASLPRYSATATAAAMADSRPQGGEPTLPSLPLKAMQDMHAAPLVWRKTPAANPDRAPATEDSWARRPVIAHARSPDGPGTRPQGGITEHPPVSQTIVPVPERSHPRFTRREWAELVERLSRLIWHKFAVDLDRRGVRLWR